MTTPATLSKLIRGEDLSDAETRSAMNAVMAGDVPPARLAAFLVALRAKGETVTELKALADVMLEYARPLEVPGPALDIVGTGGDMAHTVNISTMAALVCAGAGATVAKHGNRASSSSSGTADVLEALGLDLTADPEALRVQATRSPMTFIFAQVFHPAMRHAAATRRELGVPTAFNFLGPLTNPARPDVAAVGCADSRMAEVMAGVFAERGTDAAVFRGDDGLDEVTVTTATQVWWVWDGEVHRMSIEPGDVGLDLAPADALRGGDAVANAEVVRAVLNGERGPVRDAVVLNAGLALALVAQQRTGRLFGGEPDLASALRTGMAEAEAAIDSGKAASALRDWIEATRCTGTRSAGA